MGKLARELEQIKTDLFYLKNDLLKEIEEKISDAIKLHTKNFHPQQKPLFEEHTFEDSSNGYFPYPHFSQSYKLIEIKIEGIDKEKFYKATYKATFPLTEYTKTFYKKIETKEEEINK